MHPSELPELTARPTTHEARPVQPVALSPARTAAAVGAVGLGVAVWPSLAGLVGMQVDLRTAGIVGAAAQALVEVVASALCVRAAASRSGRWRAVWALLGGALVLAGLSTLLSIDTAGTTRQMLERLHPVDDVAAVAGAVLWCAALVVVPNDRRRQSRLLRLNTAIMVTSTFTLVWVLAADTALSSANAQGRTGLILGFLLGDAVMVGLLAAVSTRSRLDRRPDVRALFGGSAIMVIASLATVLALLGERVVIGGLAGSGLAVSGALLIAVGAERARRGTVDLATVQVRTDRFQKVAPVVALVVALVAVVAHELAETGADVPTLVLGVVCIGLATARIRLLEQTQRRLTAELTTVARRLAQEATTDALTGLGNRPGLLDHLRGALDRRAERGVSLFYIDVDDFKTVNDGLGHEAGDQLLVEIAARLRSVLGEDVFRLGGDEFVAVREDLGRPEMEAVATALVAAMERPVHVRGRRLRAAVSVGLARSEVRRQPEHVEGSGWPGRRPDSPEALLRRADLALYRAKELGRNRWATYDPWLQQRADRQLQMQQGLHSAIRAGEIDVYFQPVVALADAPDGRRVVGAEALVRWHSADHGLVLPNDFLPAAAEAGLLPEIGAVVVDAVVERLEQLDADEELWISVNLSPAELSHPAVVARLERAAAAVGPGRLHVGVREASVVDETSAATLRGLRRLGVRVLVEGFGAGPSSLRHLADYPADTVAVDRSFVDGLGDHHGDTVIVEAVADLAGELGLTLMAEGVGDERQVAVLRDLGYHLGTGWYFGRPVPWDEFRRQHLADGPARPEPDVVAP